MNGYAKGLLILNFSVCFIIEIKYIKNNNTAKADQFFVNRKDAIKGREIIKYSILNKRVLLIFNIDKKFLSSLEL
jgi:hypothetical protein